MFMPRCYELVSQTVDLDERDFSILTDDAIYRMMKR